MELSSLRAPRPVAPKLHPGDKRIHMILRDLEKIKNSKPKKQVKRCNHLVYYIAHTLRKAEDDHLLHSTAIWVLINIFRLYPEATKPVMLESGIPGILYDIIRKGTISGTSRQYASELCFYLSSNHPYPTGKDLPKNGGPIQEFPEVQVINRYQGELDDVSVMSDLSTVMNESPSRTRQPFVPYRINEANLAKMEAMFDEGYSGQLAASLPNHLLLSQYGFTQNKRRRGEERPAHAEGHISSSEDGSSESDEDSGEESNDGMGEFGRVQGLLGSRDIRKLTGKDDDDDSSVLSTLSSGSRSHVSLQDAQWKLNTPSNKRQKAATFMALQDAPGKSLVQEDSWSQGSGISFRQRKQLPYSNNHALPQRPNTTSFQSSAFNNSLQQASSTNQLPSSPPHFRLGSSGLNRPSHLMDGDEDVDPQAGYSFGFRANNSQDNSRYQNGISSAPHRLVQQLRQDPQLSQTALQYNFDSQKIEKAYKAWTSPSKGQRPQTTMSHGGLGMFTGKGLADDNLSVSSGGSAGKFPKPKPLKFSDSFLSAQASQSMIDGFSSTYPSSPDHQQSQLKRPMTSSDGVNIKAFLSDLDPLSLNVKSVVKDTLDIKSAVIAEDIDRLYDEEEGSMWNEEDWGSDDEDNELYGLKDSHMIEEDLRAEEFDPDADNPYVRQRRLRLRAEKLIDHNFIKKLFIKNATMEDTQNLIYRMEQLLQLLDPQKTGYVTFEQFTRLILAVAPKHLLRADVVNFMQAQTSNMDDLVDYTEFIISGKVLLLTKSQYQQSLESKQNKLSKAQQKDLKEAFAHRNELPDSKVWLQRQKQFVGNAATYTWKNHLKWYQTRKAQAVIWLVRRATRAMEYEGRLLEAQRYLLVKRKQAFAISYLMEVGFSSLSAKDGRLDAKRRLLKKVIKARKQILKTKEAIEFLLYSAKGALKDCAYMDRVLALKNQYKQDDDDSSSKVDPSLIPKKKKGPDYGNLFKVRNLQKLAAQFLQQKSSSALKHCARQDEALTFMRRVVEKIQIQFIMKDRARRELVLRAEAAYQFCLSQDQALLFLLRVGGNAARHIVKREAAIEWLQERSRLAVDFVNKQSALSAYLQNYGQRMLRYMNAREDAFAYLNRRRVKSQAFVIKKKEAEAFLRECPKGLWEVYDRMEEAQAWLQARAERAAAYYATRHKASQYLQFIASKAGFTYRKTYLAQQDLIQMGLLARIQYFKVSYVQHETLVKMVEEEKKIIRKQDKRHEKQRKNWSFAVRLKVELAETFEIIHSTYTPLHLLVKTPLQKLEYINPASKKTNTLGNTASGTSPMKSRPSTAQAGQMLALMDRPSTAPSLSNALVPQTPVPASTSTDVVPVASTSQRAGTSHSPTRRRNLDAPVEEVVIDKTTAQQYFIGKYAFRKLTNNGKVLQLNRTAIDEFFRNSDLNASCYITMYDIYPWFYRKASKIKNFQFRVCDVLSVEERALIQVFKKYLHDSNLLEVVTKKKKKRSDDDEPFNKYGGRLGQRATYEDSEYDDDEEEEDEIDEDLMFTDLELLKNADIGKLMRYLTKKKEEKILMIDGKEIKAADENEKIKQQIGADSSTGVEKEGLETSVDVDKDKEGGASDDPVAMENKDAEANVPKPAPEPTPAAT